MKILNYIIDLNLLTQKEVLLLNFILERASISESTPQPSLEQSEVLEVFLTLLCYENARGRVRLEWSSSRILAILLEIQEEYQSQALKQKLDWDWTDLESDLIKISEDLHLEEIQQMLSPVMESVNLDLDTLQYDLVETLICSVSQDAQVYFYFQKNYLAEMRILNGIDGLLQQASSERPIEALREVFSEPHILPQDAHGQQLYFHDRQVLSAYLAAQSPFFIISGGPGTGKTSVLVQVLRTLLRTQGDLQVEDIALCAPTGRAKARMGESLAASLDPLEAHSHRADILRDLSLKQCQNNSYTLHSLLRRQLSGHSEKLNYKVVVVDEFSMVDVHLFALLIQSLAPNCRLILLGDMHQLPPVGHGSVLGDLSGQFTQSKATLSDDLYRQILAETQSIEMDRSSQGYEMSTQEKHRLLDKIIILTKSHRSPRHIMNLAHAANDGDAELSSKLLNSCAQSEGQVNFIPRGQANQRDNQGIEEVALNFIRSHLDPQWKQALQRLADEIEHQNFGPWVKSDNEVLHSLLDQIFQPHQKMRILSLGHHGQGGTQNLNRLARQYLNPQVKDPQQRIHGELVMVTRNQNDLGLYNGDSGIAILSGEQGYVVFSTKEGYRVEPMERIHHLESAFAISVHKSQGSEYHQILLVLPEMKTQLLTREILYTGLTRAKQRAEIYGDIHLFQAGVRRYVDRPSALSEWLAR